MDYCSLKLHVAAERWLHMPLMCTNLLHNARFKVGDMIHNVPAACEAGCSSSCTGASVLSSDPIFCGAEPPKDWGSGTATSDGLYRTHHYLCTEIKPPDAT